LPLTNARVSLALLRNAEPFARRKIISPVKRFVTCVKEKLPYEADDEAFPQNPSRTPFVARYSSSRERSSARPSRVSRSFPAHDVTAFLTENKQRVLETVLTQFFASQNGIRREKVIDVHQDPFRVRVRKEETDAEGTVAMIKMMTSCLFVRLSLSPRNLDRCEKN
jgi:hypothetical protein